MQVQHGLKDSMDYNINAAGIQTELEFKLNTQLEFQLD
jgi:hypothetical protein